MTQTPIPTWKDLSFWRSRTWFDIQKILKTETVPVEPSIKNIFRPFIETPLERIKVVIVGKEPTSMMDTDGLAFSWPHVNAGSSMPSVLENIFSEYEHDLKFPTPKTGSLVPWARRGVFLWNATLTVKRGFPGSHSKIGWDELTKEVLETIYLYDKNIVFMFWTPDFNEWYDFMPEDAKIVQCGSPAVGHVHSGFFCSSPFTKANAMLEAAKIQPVDWRLL